LLDEAYALRRELEDPAGLAGILNLLGGQAYRLEEYGAARCYLEEAAAICRRYGARRHLLSPLGNLVLVAECLGEEETVVALCTEVLAVARDVGDATSVSDALLRLAKVSYQRGDLDASRSLCEEGLAIARQQEELPTLVNLLNSLGRIVYYCGELSTARALYQEAEAAAAGALSQSRYLEHQIGYARCGIARVALVEGDLRGARYLLRTILHSHQTPDAPEVKGGFGSSRLIANTLATLAGVAGAEGNPIRAVRFLGAAASLQPASNNGVPRPQAEERERLYTMLREAVGDDAFATAWSEGQAMSRDEAITYALEGTQ
jgi:tetratricopeptide (TPR) repeat protein